MAAATQAPGPLRAGVGRADITDYDAGPVEDPLYAKALVLSDGATTAALVTVDAVAIGEIGRIGKDYLPTVRRRLQAELGIPPEAVFVNASHCHGVVCADVAGRTVQAVAEAVRGLEPVKAGAGCGHEDRIMQNRRLRLRSGREADVRHAYSLPPDDEVAGIGPVDPQIGILRLDRSDGRPLAVVFNFACHPIQGVPGGGNTADLSGFASTAVETALGHGAVAFFIQGCGGDINPVWYKDVDHPRDAETLGNLLGLSVLRALPAIAAETPGPLRIVREVLRLPRADLRPTIAALEQEQSRLLQSLQGTSINLKTFLHLSARYGLDPGFPSYYSHAYLHQHAQGRHDLTRLDSRNREQLQAYRHNIHTMERLTRLQANVDLLRMHQAQSEAVGFSPLEAEIVGLRVGQFVLLGFPGELSVQIGLNIKSASPHEFTFVAGCSNGYIYYAPTAEQLQNRGGAQEDSDCLLAAEWQGLFEARTAEVLGRL
jgi:hypothetical protein